MKREILAILSLLLFSAFLPIMPGVRADVIHDVAVTNVTVSSNWVYQGWSLGINVTVENFGTEIESFTLTVFYDSNVIATQNIQNLAPSATLEVLFSWNTASVPPGLSYNIKAVASTVPGETNTDNNTLDYGPVKVRIMGDINDDNKVDVYDADIFAGILGSEIGQPRWNPDADLNQNGVVDVFDAVILAEHA
jgi:hypothetical protein